MLDVSGQSIFLTRGDSGDIEVEVYVSDDERYTLLDTDTIMFRLRRSLNDRIAIEKECAIDLENNVVILSFEPEETENLDMDEYRYELELINSEKKHYTFVADQSFTIGTELEDHDE